MRKWRVHTAALCKSSFKSEFHTMVCPVSVDFDDIVENMILCIFDMDESKCVGSLGDTVCIELFCTFIYMDQGGSVKSPTHMPACSIPPHRF